jgi:endonuclease YncB( thermonuclease family)
MPLWGAALSLVLGLLAFGCSRREKEPEAPTTPETSASETGTKDQPNSAPPSALETFTGETAKVLKVTDADTLTIKMGKKTFDVKLYGVVVPEKNPVLREKAKKFAARLVGGKEVLVDAKRKENSGRIIAMVSLPPGPNLNHELVREGYAWWDQKSARDIYAKDLQDQAKMAKKGLWAGPTKASKKKG